MQYNLIFFTRGVARGSVSVCLLIGNLSKCFSFRHLIRCCRIEFGQIGLLQASWLGTFLSHMLEQRDHSRGNLLVAEQEQFLYAGKTLKVMDCKSWQAAVQH